MFPLLYICGYCSRFVKEISIIPLNKMKFLILFITVTFGALALASPPHPCQCWPDWKPVKEGEEWHCEDPKGSKTFACNIDIPPTCACWGDSGFETLPLGEINCVGGDHNKFKKPECDSTPEWEAWFTKYPQYRILH